MHSLSIPLYYGLQISEDALLDEDIQKVRKIRELEPLQNAWTEWTHAKQVRVTLSCMAMSWNRLHAKVVSTRDITAPQRPRSDHAKYG